MKKGSKFLSIALLLMVVMFLSTACQKLSPTFLRANEHFQKANSYYRDEVYRRAAEEYEKALELNPELTRAYPYLGTAYASLYRPGDESEKNKQIGEKADMYLKKALDLDQENKGLIYSLGEFNDRRRNFEEAEKFFLKVLNMDPNDGKIYIVLANFYNSYDKKDQALEMYEKRIALDPSDVDAYLFPADYYFNRRNWGEAIRYQEMRLQKILETSFPDEKTKNAKLADAYYRIGHLHWNQSYQTPVDMMSDNERTSIIDKGVEALQKAIDANREYAEPYVYMGLLWLEKDKIWPEKHDQHQKMRDEFVARFSNLMKAKKQTEQTMRDLEKK